ncbi:MAG: Hpt domain-containing protein, partial [Myxococcota bacterium]
MTPLDMSKYRALFIEQSREHLEDLSRTLAAEALPAGAVDEVFRHVHSIKGMAASMGYEPIATLAHRFEDVVGERRDRGGVFDSRLVDALLEAVDVLAAQVAAVA